MNNQLAQLTPFVQRDKRHEHNEGQTYTGTDFNFIRADIEYKYCRCYNQISDENVIRQKRKIKVTCRWCDLRAVALSDIKSSIHYPIDIVKGHWNV